MISIHSLRVEGDLGGRSELGGCKYFNPLPPCGGRPGLIQQVDVSKLFQSTPSVWRETGIYNFDNVFCVISIHSLRVEGDIVTFNTLGAKKISIHSLRVEGDTLKKA